MVFVGGTTSKNEFTLPKTNELPVKMNGLEDEIPFGMALFQARNVSFRECNSGWWLVMSEKNLPKPAVNSLDVFFVKRWT